MLAESMLDLDTRGTRCLYKRGSLGRVSPVLMCNIYIHIIVGGCNDVNDISAEKKAKKKSTRL
ncbi:hypothetical protein SDC9_153558 [bioreactor metagenome]|uniref:Uncharacterized protein n=1 Tax=bioreactor metagenome TaxID=1076179 RepID=A0A645EYH8_9ZZZZ